ncbi:MAG TPA: hypothetical protein VNQ33_11860, partial [Acidimicrobiales bacterium]|nr:hypothetical protein [Acidimicrobiales bacterium]
MKIRMVVVVLLASLLVGLNPVAGGSAPGRERIAPPGVASAPRIWYSDFGTGVDGMAIDPGTGRAFVREGATFGGADLVVAGPDTYDAPVKLTGPYGYPVASAGSIFVFRDGMLRRIDPASLSETGSWTVPGLSTDLWVTSVGGDIVWVTRSSEAPFDEQLYRFDPVTGTTTTSGPTNLGYA